MADKCILRIAKLHIHNLAKTQRHCADRKRLSSRTHPELASKNKVACLQDKNGKHLTLRQAFERKTKNINVRKNAVVMFEVVCAFSPEQQKRIEQEGINYWVKSNFDFIAEQFGGKKNIVRFQLDYDEKTPHLHFFLIPINDKGKLSATSFISGPADLSKLQDLYADAMIKHGLTRGEECYKTGKKRRKHKTIKEYWKEQEMLLKAERDQLYKGKVALACDIVEKQIKARERLKDEQER